MRRSRSAWIVSFAVSCLAATFSRGADEGTVEKALDLSKRSGLPILAVAGSKT